MAAEYTYRHRVRYRECDPMGAVYHTHYLDWFEAARTEMVRSWGTSYASIEARGISMPAVEVHLEYLASARYDDVVLVRVWVPERPRARIRFEGEVRREESGELLARGQVILCFLDRKSSRAVRAPSFLVDEVAKRLDGPDRRTGAACGSQARGYSSPHESPCLETGEPP